MTLSDVSIEIEESVTQLEELSSITLVINDAMLSETSSPERYVGAMHLLSVHVQSLFDRMEKLKDELFTIIQN